MSSEIIELFRYVDSFRDLWALLRYLRYTFAQATMLFRLIWWLGGIALTLVSFMVAWYVFQKAGKKAWACFIPYYDDFVWYEIAFGSGWWSLFRFVPLAKIVFRMIMSIKLAWSFGKGTWFGIGLIFFPLLFKAIIALDDRIVYRGPVK